LKRLDGRGGVVGPKSMIESSEEEGDNKGGDDKFSTAGLVCDGKTSIDFFQGEPWSSCTFMDTP